MFNGIRRPRISEEDNNHLDTVQNEDVLHISCILPDAHEKSMPFSPFMLLTLSGLSAMIRGMEEGHAWARKRVPLPWMRHDTLYTNDVSS